MELDPYAERRSNWLEVETGKPGQSIDRLASPNVAVIVREGCTAKAGPGGLAYAGAKGNATSLAKVERYGVAICGNEGTAEGGAGCVVFAYDGGTATGGDGAVAVARRGGGGASCGVHGIASALDANATATRPASVAIVRRQNGGKGGAQVVAQVESGGVAIARDYLPKVQRPALAKAAAGAIAIAFENNLVTGEVGALLVGTYVADGQTRFVAAMVDGKEIRARIPYRVDENGRFVVA